MKKYILTGCYLLLMVVSVYLLQLFLIDNKQLFGVKPNLILISTIVVCIWFGRKVSIGYGIAMGIICDLLFHNTYGGFTIAYAILAIVLSVCFGNDNKENKLSLIYITLIGTAIFEVIQYIEYVVMFHVYSNVFYLIKQIILSSLLNIAIVFVMYTLFHKVISFFEERLERGHRGF